MTSPRNAFEKLPSAAGVFAQESSDGAPILLVSKGDDDAYEQLNERQRAWIDATGFEPSAKRMQLVPGEDGTLAAAVFGGGDGQSGEPCGTSELLIGQLAQQLPPGTYNLAHGVNDPGLAAMAWGLGAYGFDAYRQNGAEGDRKRPRLMLPAGTDRGSVLNTIEAVWFGRDLINTPASDLGPEELEAAARTLTTAHGASISVIAGDELLTQNFPMIHAVGRASDRAPRLIDLNWSPVDATTEAPQVTLVGKGICFDTGGLDLKTAAGMILMKKDMGGAATALSLAHMIMGQALNVRLRVLIPAAENSVSGNAFRPSDILYSRAGKTVEIGNTDAEGRLVLADALSLADEDKPDLMISLATLTGAARVALGPDLPAFFCNDPVFTERVVAAGQRIGDPVWHMPYWKGYRSMLDSQVADIRNVGDGPFAGAITAALFLREFVSNTERYAHLDLYGWRPVARPLGPKGGEPHSARALFEALRQGVA